MPKTQALSKISINPSLISFKPRQVLLANPSLKPNMNKATVRALKHEQKALLLLSVAGFLKSNGFPKTLKKFLSEAQLDKDDFSNCSLDLENICCKYFEASDNGSTISCKKVHDLQKDDNSKRGEVAECAKGVETVSKKKKKRSDEDSHAVVMQSEDSGKLTDSKETEKEKSKEKRQSKKISDSLSQEDKPENTHKEKKKKIGKLDSESLVDGPLGSEDNQGNKAKESEFVRDTLATETTVVNGNDASLDDERVNVKGKKKKKDDSMPKNVGNKTSEEGTTDKEWKGSKKRKRLASEDNNAEPINEKEVEESKRRKTEGSEKLSRNDQVNGNLEKEEKSVPNKSTKKQLNGSAEPTTVKAFQRVKVDEVTFTDERLKDNSYWAKDGAEIGYGAKAQEVLGQVRGRDFRHEKTKKKRGSYRGGLIDLQSHSVKFNYSDEE